MAKGDPGRSKENKLACANASLPRAELQRLYKTMSPANFAGLSYCDMCSGGVLNITLLKNVDGREQCDNEVNNSIEDHQDAWH